MYSKDNLSISVIIPAYNAEGCLPALLDSLKDQSRRPDEVLLIDDHSTDNTREVALKYGVNVIGNVSKGPAAARNLGINTSKCDILAFIDADCVADKDWIKNIAMEFGKPQTRIIMGKVIIPKSTFLGDVISGLGFPAGGHVGFDKMWHVDKDGKTDHIGSGNFAIRKSVIQDVGLFDDTFPYPGCEDVEFSIRCVKKGIPIYYKESAVVIHPPRKTLSSFMKWHLLRGRSNYHLKRKIKKVGSLIRLRIWSSKNICKKYRFDIKLPFIIALLFLSFVLQQVGYLLESFGKVGARK